MMRLGEQMKKRYYVLLMMFVACLWICGTKIAVCAEDKIKTEPADMPMVYDTLLSEFMNVGHDSVIAPGFEKNDSLWKIILLAVVLILDVIVAVVVYLNLKQNPKKTDEPTAQTTELSEEETVAVKEKLQSNMKMNNDDMEYLKSIGYFDSKSSKGKDV